MITAKFSNTTTRVSRWKSCTDGGGGILLPYYKDHDYELHKHELETQLESGLDWDDYDPEHYGWWRELHSRTNRRANVELAKELTMFSIPHKTRRFRKP